MAFIAVLGIVAFFWQWPPRQPVLLAWSALSCAFLVLFLTAALEGRRLRWPAATSMLVLAEATVALGSSQASDGHGYLAGSLTLMGAAAVGFVPAAVRPSTPMVKDGLGAAGLTVWVIGTLVLAGFIGSRGPDPQVALTAVCVSEFFFDILVFALFRQRFHVLVDDEVRRQTKDRPQLTTWAYLNERAAEPDRNPAPPGDFSGYLAKVMASASLMMRDHLDEDEPRDDPPQRFGYVPNYPTLFIAAGSCLIALAVLVGFAAGPLGINALARSGEPGLDTTLLFLGAAAVAAVLALLAGRSRPWRPRGEETPSETPHLRIGCFGLIASLAGASVWVLAPLLAPWLLGAPRHLELLTLVPALAYGAFTAESLVSSSAMLQLDEPGRAGWAIAIAGGVATASASWWLFSVGAWSHGGPAEVFPLVLVTLVVLGGTTALAICLGRTLVASGAEQKFTPQPARGNVTLDHLLYALFMILLGVLPVAIVAHLVANPGAAQSLVASLAFIPGLFGAFIWVVDNNDTHHRHEQQLELPTKPIWIRAEQICRLRLRSGQDLEVWDLPDTANRLLARYKRAMSVHSRIQNRGSTALLVLATMTVASYLLAA